MTRSAAARPFPLGYLAVALALAACSSSKPMTSKLDGAWPDGLPDRPGDLAVDAAGLADSAQPPSDAVKVTDAPGDLPERADAPPPKDATAVEAPVDKPAPDTADAPADGPRDGKDGAPPDQGTVLDLGSDLAAVCTPGMDQTCNDSEIASSLWGGCTASGTCICKAGYEINPSTGRCRLPPRDAAGDIAVGACTAEFLACGCGCCGGTTPTMVCYYPALGETTASLRAADEQVRQSTNCELAGCSFGRRYVCCAAGEPDPVGSASYTADGYIGGLNHLTVTKSGADCAVLQLSEPFTADDRMALQTTGQWRVGGARLGGCADGGPVEAARGVLGSLDIREVTDGCVVDVHASLFAFSSTGEVKTTRMDADGIPIGGMGKELCR